MRTSSGPAFENGDEDDDDDDDDDDEDGDDGDDDDDDDDDDGCRAGGSANARSGPKADTTRILWAALAHEASRGNARSIPPPADERRPSGGRNSHN